MTQELVDLGSAPNAGDGDPARTAFGKVNNNANDAETRLTDLESAMLPLSRVLYVDTNAASGGDGSIGSAFNTIDSAQTAIIDATLDNPYTLLIAGDDTNVPSAFKDFVYYKGTGVKETTILKGAISDSAALTVLFNNLTIEDDWTFNGLVTLQIINFANVVFTSTSTLSISSDGTVASEVNFIDNTFNSSGPSVVIATKTFNSRGNDYLFGLSLLSANSDDMIVNMDNDKIDGVLVFLTVATRPMTATLTNVQVNGPVLFTLVAGANLTLILDESTYNSMVEAGTDFNIPNLVVLLPFQITIAEEFAAINAKYIGELGLPSLQGFTDTTGGSSTITIASKTVFGVVVDTVKYTVIGGGQAESNIPVSADDWTDILTFGASFASLACSIEEETGNGIFAGMGFAAANDPRPSSIQSRVGFFVKEDGTFTTVQLDGSSLVTLDGTGGNPTVFQDEFFTWECKINPTPDAGTNFGTVELFVNSVLVTTGAIVSSNNAVNDVASVNRSSSSGTTTFFMGQFGVTIYTETNTKTLEAITMQGNVVQVLVPAGNRDYIIELPNGNPQDVGATLEIIPSNLGGSVTLTNESFPADALFNFLSTLVLDITSPQVLIGINREDNGNNYFGFTTTPIDENVFVVTSLQDVLKIPGLIQNGTDLDVTDVGTFTLKPRGTVDISPNRFFCQGNTTNTIVIDGENQGKDILVTDHASDMFFFEDCNVLIRWMNFFAVNAVNGCFNVKNTADNEKSNNFQMFNSFVNNSIGGVFEDLATVSIFLPSFLGNTSDGFSFIGDFTRAAIQDIQFENYTGTAIDLGTATFDSIAILASTDLPTISNVFLNGAANSANLNAGGQGLISNIRFEGTVDPTITNILSSDLQWTINNSPPLIDSFAAGFFNLTTTALTSLPSQNTYVKIAGTTVAFSGNSRVTQTASNEFQWDSLTPEPVVISAQASFTKTGAAEEYEMTVFKDDGGGFVIIDAAIIGCAEIKTTTVQFAVTVPDTPSPGDKYSIFIQCTSNTGANLTAECMQVEIR